MNTPSLATTLANREVIDDPYWLNMEIVEDNPDDGMSIGEAGAIIDTMYGIDTCGSENSDIWNLGGTREPAEEPPEEDLFNQVIGGIAMVLPFCSSLANSDDPGAYDTKIKVFRSHPLELYRLRLSNGTATGPQRVEERVIHTLDISDQTHITLDNPINLEPGTKEPVFFWQGFDGPEIKIKGNTLYWDGIVTGTLRAEFDTVYDLIAIRVHGQPTNSQIVEGTLPPLYMGEGWFSGSEDTTEITDIQDIQCSVLGFYHYQYEELILSRPEEDESVSDADKYAICAAGATTSFTPGAPPNEEEEKNCYRLNDITEICHCSKDEKINRGRVAVVCPDGVAAGTELEDAEPETTYVDCGEKDKVNDHAFYEETCCEEWPFDQPMPKCEKFYRAFINTVMDSDEKEKLKQQYENIAFVGVPPASNICGEWLLEQVVRANNCCDDAPQIYWNDGASAETIGGNSSASVFVTGGLRPLKWQVRGDGFYTNAACTERDAETETNELIIYTKEACGTAQIYVSDGCSSVTGEIRSTNGHWEVIDPLTAPDRSVTADSIIGNNPTGQLGGVCRYIHFQAIKGRFMYRQKYAAYSTGLTIGGGCGSCDNLGNKTWQEYLSEIQQYHDMGSEPELISRGSMSIEDMLLYPVCPYPGSLLPWSYSSTGRGVTKVCKTIGGYNLNACYTRAEGLIRYQMISTVPQAWEWVC